MVLPKEEGPVCARGQASNGPIHIICPCPRHQIPTQQSMKLNNNKPPLIFQGLQGLGGFSHLQSAMQNLLTFHTHITHTHTHTIITLKFLDLMVTGKITIDILLRTTIKDGNLQSMRPPIWSFGVDRLLVHYLFKYQRVCNFHCRQIGTYFIFNASQS